MVFSLRGDSHKFYLKLKKKLKREQSHRYIKELREIDDIQRFYDMIDSVTLEKIYYHMKKEKSALGIIPIYVTSIPWLLFLFADQLQQFLFRDGNLPFVIFVSVYMFILTISSILHFQEKAWVTVHIEIIEDILNGRRV